MAQHDYNIANQTGLEFRVDLNNALQAVVTDNSGPSEPVVTFPGMVWRDTGISPSVLKKRTDADDGWVPVLTAAGEAISGANTSSDQRTALGLGTAATKDVGTLAGNVVQLDASGKLPAVDGSLLTNLPNSIVFASSAENAAGTVENKAVDPLGVREAFNATGTAPVYACRAWVNFDGTGTVAIRASGNVSSITDNGTGNYTVNFTTAMPDASYCVSRSFGMPGGTYSYEGAVWSFGTSSVRTLTQGSGSSAVDREIVSIAIFR